MYWAVALAEQTKDAELQARFTALAQKLLSNEATIVAELNAVQGQSMDIGGYFKPDAELASKAMRPSATFNAALAAL
jgi:isocitrate dehydrogenase